MTAKVYTIDEIKDIVTPIAIRHRVTKMYLFGSYARGEADAKSDIDILKHILRYCNNIEQLIGRFGKDFSAFKSDLAFRDSVSMNILQIGELVGHLSEDYRIANIY